MVIPGRAGHILWRAGYVLSLHAKEQEDEMNDYRYCAKCGYFTIHHRWLFWWRCRCGRINWRKAPVRKWGAE